MNRKGKGARMREIALRWGMRGGGAGAGWVAAGLVAAGLLAAPTVGFGQSLDELDYENLSLRGMTLDFGRIQSAKVESANAFGARLDLGFLGPGVRVVVGGTHWSSRLEASEIRRFEEKVEDLIEGETGERPTVRFGDITWSNVAIHTDAHLVWRVPGGVLTYLGVGGTAHVLRGGGSAVEGTFVGDLLNTIRAGVNAHAGVEVPVTDRFRLTGESRVELVQGVSHVQLRVGAGVLWGALAPGERR
jgi:hypothetical protein